MPIQFLILQTVSVRINRAILGQVTQSCVLEFSAATTPRRFAAPMPQATGVAPLVENSALAD